MEWTALLQITLRADSDAPKFSGRRDSNASWDQEAVTEPRGNGKLISNLFDTDFTHGDIHGQR